MNFLFLNQIWNTPWSYVGLKIINSLDNLSFVSISEKRLLKNKAQW